MFEVLCYFCVLCLALKEMINVRYVPAEKSVVDTQRQQDLMERLTTEVEVNEVTLRAPKLLRAVFNAPSDGGVYFLGNEIAYREDASALRGVIADLDLGGPYRAQIVKAIKTAKGIRVENTQSYDFISQTLVGLALAAVCMKVAFRGGEGPGKVKIHECVSAARLHAEEGNALVERAATKAMGLYMTEDEKVRGEVVASMVKSDAKASGTTANTEKTPFCFYCRATGHKERQCPVKKAKLTKKRNELEGNNAVKEPKAGAGKKHASKP